MKRIVLWLPGKLEHEQNRTPWSWQKRARYRKAIRERVAQHILVAMGRRAPWPAATPKLVTFTVHCYRPFDSDDNLRWALKTHKDALRDMNLIDNDQDSSGHRFEYHQQISRGKDAKRGVEISVTAEETP